MKKYFLQEKINWQKNYQKIIVRFIIYIIGLYIFGLSIVLYMYLALGNSQIDISVYAFLGLARGLEMNGRVSDFVINNYYSTMLTYYYLGMLIVVILLRCLNCIGYYRQKKDSSIYIKQIVLTVIDLILVFAWAYSVKLSQLYLGQVLPAWLKGDLQNALWAKTFFFLLAFVVYCIGIGLTVYTDMLYGVYNGIATEFMILTKQKYFVSRIICDFGLAIVGILAMAFSSMPEKNGFFNLYLGFGTIFYIFIAGPLINVFLKQFSKRINVDKIAAFIFPVKKEITKKIQ